VRSQADELLERQRLTDVADKMRAPASLPVAPKRRGRRVCERAGLRSREVE
jgi:hypothetical protein